PVERRVGMGLVRPCTVRPVAGVWANVDSRPVPPRFLALGFGLLALALALGLGLGRLAFFGPFFRAVRALGRRVGAFFRLGATAFFLEDAFLPLFALRAAFFAMWGSCRPLD